MRHCRLNKRLPQGFTLIEMMVVLLLITLVFSVTIPKMDTSIVQNPRKKTTRWIKNTVRELRAAAIEKQIAQIMVVNLDLNRIWVTNEAMDEEAKFAAAENGFRLPGSLHMIDVEFPAKDRIGGGQAELVFYPGGYSDHATINLENDDAERFSFTVEPLLPRVKVLEEWVNY